MAASADIRGIGSAVLEDMRQNWGWFIALGIALILIGSFAIGYAFVATFTTVVVFGWLLVISGAAQTVHAFWRERSWSRFFIDLFAGILSLVVGFMLVANPLAGAETLTLLISMFLIIAGVERIVVSLTGHIHHGGWLLLAGVIDVTLGVMIWRHWPSSGLWVIGLFVGIDMIFNGWALVMQGVALKMLRSHETLPSQAV
jgi:uncharacterized membrane protein HdeD (DUF308 family)